MAYILWTSLIWFKFLGFFSSHLVQPRKSYEFEDLLQSSSENSRVDWYAQTKLGLTRTLSEENVYEDILGKRPKCLRESACEKEGEGGGAGCLKHTHAGRQTCTQMREPGRRVDEWPRVKYVRENERKCWRWMAREAAWQQWKTHGIWSLNIYAWILTLLLVSCVTLGRPLSVSELRFSHLCAKEDDRYLTGLLEDWRRW